MKLNNTLLLAVLVLTLALPGMLVAETRYVSDTLEITMRAGAGTKYKITAMLKSGTELEILSSNKKSG